MHQGAEQLDGVIVFSLAELNLLIAHNIRWLVTCEIFEKQVIGVLSKLKKISGTSMHWVAY